MVEGETWTTWGGPGPAGKLRGPDDALARQAHQRHMVSFYVWSPETMPSSSAGTAFRCRSLFPSTRSPTARSGATTSPRRRSRPVNRARMRRAPRSSAVGAPPRHRSTVTARSGQGQLPVPGRLFQFRRQLAVEGQRVAVVVEPEHSGAAAAHRACPEHSDESILTSSLTPFVLRLVRRSGVDRELQTRDVPRLVRGQEQDGVRHVPRFTYGRGGSSRPARTAAPARRVPRSGRRR